MKPPRFRYVDPRTVSDAVAILHEYGDESKGLAGGQSFIPLLNMRLARPGVIVDLNQIAELAFIRPSDDGVVIGAMTRQRALETDPLIAERLPVLRETVRWIGHPQIRSRGTIGGSIAHGDPAAELPAAALALDATLEVIGPSGTRTLTPDDLYLGYLDTALGADEILTEIRIPALPANSGWSIQEIARRAGDFALAGAIATVALDEDRTRIDSARVVCFGVAGRPVRFADVEGLVAGRDPSERLFTDAGRLVSDALHPDDDVHAPAEYRRSVAGTLTKRALLEATQRATGAIA